MQYQGTDLNVVLAGREAELDRREAELHRVEQEVARLEGLRVEMLRLAAQLDVREASLAARSPLVRAPGLEALREPPLSPPLSPPLTKPLTKPFSEPYEQPSDAWEESWWARRLGQPLGSGQAAA
jgi:hypothetical protein